MNNNNVTDKFFDKLDLIDLAVATAPSKELFEKQVRPLIQNELIGEYFYDALSDVSWLAVLVAAKEFNKFGGTEGRLVQAAKLRYLSRIAPQHAKEVAPILAQIQTDDDPWIVEAFLSTLVVLPYEQSAPLVDRMLGKPRAIAEWQNFRILCEWIIKLAKSGHDEQAALLVSEILRIPDINTYELKEFLFKTVPEVVQNAKSPLNWVQILADSIVSEFVKEDQQCPNDYSYIWRPAIEEHEQNIESRRVDYLVSAVRDSAAWSAKDSTELTIEKLLSFKWDIFRRIAIHISIDSKSNSWRKFIMDTELALSQNVWHEYSVLLSRRFRDLQLKEKESWLESLESLIGKSDLTDIAKDAALRDRLTLIRESLPDKYKEQLTALESKYGRAEHPDFLRYSTPVEFLGGLPSDETASISKDQFISILSAKDFNDKLDEKTKEWLILRLPVWVAEQPKVFAELDTTLDLPPEMMASILSGFTSAMRGTEVFDMTLPIRICERLAVQRKGERSVANFIFDAVSIRTNSFALEAQKDSLWKAIIELIEHSQDPGPSDAIDPRTNASIAINSTRGQALHGAFQLVFRLKSEKSLKESDLEILFKLLDGRLDLAAEKSCAVRSVIGEWLPWIIELNEGWVKANTAKLFADDAPGHALWNAYLDRNPLYKPTFEALQPQYERAIGRLTKDIPETLKSVVRKLCEHICTAYVIDLIKRPDDGLAKAYFSNAPDWLRTYAIEFFGELGSNDKLKTEHLAKIVELWNSRIQQNDRATLAGVGYLFVAKRFEVSWQFEQLLRVLSGGTLPEEVYPVLAALAEHSQNRPAESLSCMSMIVKLLQPKWKLHQWQSELRTILTSALNSNNKDAQAEAIEAIHSLGSFGLLSLRDMLRKSA